MMALSLGCGAQPVTYQVQATLNEQPITNGQILFVVPGEPPEAADIVDGQFTGHALPGAKRVEIYAFRPGVQDPNDPFPVPVEGELLENFVPEKYNVHSTLTAEITPDGPNEFEFNLTSPSP